VTETLDLDADLPVADPSRIHQIASGVTGTLTGTSTVPATKVWSDYRTIGAASETLDFTALVRTPLANLDASGLKLQLMLLKADSTNVSAGIVFADGASNGYNLLGDASGQVTLLPGQVLFLYGGDKAQDVAAGDKTIDVTGDATDKYKIVLVFG
jgi:hypothetical protein